jgi:hypothetical protein
MHTACGLMHGGTAADAAAKSGLELCGRSETKSRWVFNSSSQRWTRGERPRTACTDASGEEVRSASISSTNETWGEGDGGGAWWREVERLIKQDECASNVGGAVASRKATHFRLHGSPEQFNLGLDDSGDDAPPECSSAKRHKMHQPGDDREADWWQHTADEQDESRSSSSVTKRPLCADARYVRPNKMKRPG